MKLVNNRGYEWHSNSRVYFKGYMYHEDRQLSFEEIGVLCENFREETEISDWIQSTNGCFAIVIDSEDFTFAAVDFIRSIPLFYKSENEFELSDIAYELTTDEFEIDEIAAAEYKVSGITWANRTLSTDVKGLGNAEYLYYDKRRKTLNVKEYRSFRYSGVASGSADDMARTVYDNYLTAIKRLLNGIGDRTIVIPLSGGEDSRIVAHSIHALGYENVICFSYGQTGNFEAELSKKIADYLGYKWIFVSYDELDWKLWFESEEFADFSRYAGNLVSIPHIQDYHAVKQMSEKGLIPKDSVFVPGHTGDLLHGNHIPKLFILRDSIKKKNIIVENLRELAGNIIWGEAENRYKSQMIEDMDYASGGIVDCTSKEACEYLEHYDWKEKHGKLLANSIRVYEYFGYQWRLPLWDRDVVAYWMSVEPRWRYERNLHYVYVRNHQKALREGIGAASIRQPITEFKYGLKDFVRWLSPELFRSLVMRKKNNELKNSYDTHIHKWYTVLDKNEFDKISDRINNINGLIALKQIEALKSSNRGN